MCLLEESAFTRGLKLSNHLFLAELISLTFKTGLRAPGTVLRDECGTSPDADISALT